VLGRKEKHARRLLVAQSLDVRARRSRPVSPSSRSGRRASAVVSSSGAVRRRLVLQEEVERGGAGRGRLAARLEGAWRRVSAARARRALGSWVGFVETRVVARCVCRGLQGA
jgi:hypothetical protein